MPFINSIRRNLLEAMSNLIRRYRRWCIDKNMQMVNVALHSVNRERFLFCDIEHNLQYIIINNSSEQSFSVFNSENKMKFDEKFRMTFVVVNIFFHYI